MTSVNRIVLDVLKPHEPNVLEFASGIATVGSDYRVCVSVHDVDKETETVEVEVFGGNIDFQQVHEMIKAMGGSLHSIDEVDVSSEVEETGAESTE